MAGARGGSGGFALLAETLLVGVLMVAVSVPVVTIVPAVAAGTAHLRRHLAGEADTVSRFLGDVALAWRRGWTFAVAATALLALLAVNVGVVLGGDLPGGTAVGLVTGFLIAAVVVITLRTSAVWSSARDVQSWWVLARETATRAGADPYGSVMVLLALGMCVLFVWMLTPLVVVVPGLLALALVAVEKRFEASGPG